ncbi:non-ribosomal peptide synthetase [Nocardia stercoris]|uniref:Amino acid adenylation domain-containing protein n=1 Tax=Nocardia stercoris TaxID=2483361 RepID=A0A3M2L7B3_9NOCA|nr:non-ribosomal peptide synthetase [Nocardia stercoris]RMI30418.1 amino acid adenylation domain-containing protein [Nocardia stercoris]
MTSNMTDIIDFEFEQLSVLAGHTADFDAEYNLAHQVSAIAAHSPDAPAVQAPDGDFSYAELDRHANRIAAALRGYAAGPEVAVGVTFGRSRFSVATMLAVWRLGAVYVPLDPSHPDDRVAAIAADSALAVIVAPEGTLPVSGAIPRLDPRSLDDDSDGPVSFAAALPDSAAYTIYTSGTTGTPKGVQITYRNVANLANALRRLDLPDGSACGNVAPSGFDAWIWSTLLPLAGGHAVVLHDPLDEHSEKVFTALDAITATPSLLSAYDAIVAAGAGPRTVVVAGEACPPALAELWSSNRRLINAYGPTEVTICATWADSAAGDSPLTIGRPITNYRALVLDSELKPVPIGAEGELFLAGPGVGRGYRNMPETTAARFVADPHASGARMYRTGDVVRVHDDRTIEFVGRADHQIKIRGSRVELKAVETAAVGVAGVRQAIAFGIPEAVGMALGLALVVDEGAPADLVAVVRAAMEDTLPEFMIPSTFVCVDAIPLTVNGKADLAALQQSCLRESPAGDTTTAAAPADDFVTATELAVAQVWSDVFDRRINSRTAHFVELGGHSLLAARVVRGIGRSLGAAVSVRDLLEHPTVAEFAATVDRIIAEAGSH